MNKPNIDTNIVLIIIKFIYFSILKSKLQKLEGLTYNEIKLNITKAINEIFYFYFIRNKNKTLDYKKIFDFFIMKYHKKLIKIY